MPWEAHPFHAERSDRSRRGRDESQAWKSQVSANKDHEGQMLKHYSHTGEEFKRDAMRKLGEALKLAQKSSTNPTTITQDAHSIKLLNNL